MAALPHDINLKIVVNKSDPIYANMTKDPIIADFIKYLPLELMIGYPKTKECSD